MSGTRNIADRVAESEILPGVRVLSMKTETVDVVTLYGSLLGGNVFTPRSNSAVAEMTARMLDQGSVHRDKFQISDSLENVGATLSFVAGLYRVRFTGRCLSKDLPLLIELLAEQLRSPAVNGKDLETAKRRRIGELKRLKDDTRTRAMGTFLQTVYPEDHPNYFVPLRQQIEHTERVRDRDVKAFHRDYYGTGHLNLVGVGDIDPEKFERTVEGEFSGWKESPLSVVVDDAVRAKKTKGDKRQVVTIKDKTSVDVVIGQPIGIDREHEDFLPLMVGLFALGGNFSSRLMTVVRDELGLTYGTGCSLDGVDNGNDGFWYILGSYAPELVREGHRATVDQLKRWASEGITAEELGQKKTTITGNYKVGLATTGGLASRILITVEREKRLNYIDEYPRQIDGITHGKVNRTIKKYSHPDRVLTVAAGSINDEWEPLDEE